MGRRILVYIQLVCVLAQSDTMSFWQAVKLFQKKNPTKQKQNKKTHPTQTNRTPKQPEYFLEEKGSFSGPGGKTEKRIWSESKESCSLSITLKKK